MTIHTFFMAPTSEGTGLTSVCLGMLRGLEQRGLRVAFFKPIAQELSQTQSTDSEAKPDAFEPSTHMVRSMQGQAPATPIALEHAQQLLAQNRTEQLMEEVVQRFDDAAGKGDIVIVEGLVPSSNLPLASRLNQLLAKSLDCEVILVSAKNRLSLEQLNERIGISANLFGGPNDPKLLGLILNKVGAPDEPRQPLSGVETDSYEVPKPLEQAQIYQSLEVLQPQHFPCLGAIPWEPSLLAPRTLDVAKHLKATLIHPGQISERRVEAVTICARTMVNMLHTLRAGTLVVVPGDREDVIMAACMAALDGTPLAGILITGDIDPDERVIKLCHSAFEQGLPLLATPGNTISTAQRLYDMSHELPKDDLSRIDKVMNAAAEFIDLEYLAQHTQVERRARLSPPAFRHLLVQRAKSNRQRIILPEGEEIRTIEAASICASKGMAHCILLGKAEKIHHQAQRQNITLGEGVEIIDPDDIRQRYVESLVALRKHKGMNSTMAQVQLEDNVMLATLMLAQNEVDGLVSGAVNTTANTIRPALQLIKTRPDSSIVSSVFFMCLPEQLMVFGDCAVNPDPSAEQLADIAIQSGDSAQAFGIEAKIAMISYSTGHSGSGDDVDKVRAATAIARQKRPDLIIDGPLQYDAATVASVAAKKAPDSPVAGQATVLVFPDLNTGNTTYKAVQRSANVVSIGPMLQGLNKPVNDLSRGALVEDIVYTIALTAIQAQH